VRRSETREARSRESFCWFAGLSCIHRPVARMLAKQKARWVGSNVNYGRAGWCKKLAGQ
jgi:hypothetical protein